jgi:hypothetical protein
MGAMPIVRTGGQERAVLDASGASHQAAWAQLSLIGVVRGPAIL